MDSDQDSTSNESEIDRSPHLSQDEPKSTNDSIVPSASISILLFLSLSHLLNDTIQSLIAAVYPILKESYALSFTQIGLITLAFQLSSSVLQPLIGFVTDKKPFPFSLVLGMGVTLIGLVCLSKAMTFEFILVSACLVGIGSAVFHPEASRMARMASGGRHGFAQSLFQVGGNAGSALGPLLASFIVAPWGQSSLAWFSVLAVLAMVFLFRVGNWYSFKLQQSRSHRGRMPNVPRVTRGQAVFAIGILLTLVFSKYFYLASITSYYTFYLMETFNVSVADAQFRLFIFLAAVAAGTFLGGPIGDRVGYKHVIWGSILGVLPFTLLLPYANLTWTTILSIPIGLIIASAFSAIMVYAQELIPSKVGMVAGLFFGFAFGMGGIGAAFLGWLADQTSIEYVYHVCSYLPLLGLLTAFLPNLKRHA